MRVDLETSKLLKNLHPDAYAIRVKYQKLVKNGGTYPEKNFSLCLLFYQGRGCLNFHARKKKMFEKIKKIVDSICDYNYSGDNDEESRDKEEAAIIIENDQLKPFSDTATDQSKLVSYTDSSSKEEEDLHVDFNFDEQTDVAIN